MMKARRAPQGSEPRFVEKGAVACRSRAQRRRGTRLCASALALNEAHQVALHSRPKFQRRLAPALRASDPRASERHSIPSMYENLAPAQMRAPHQRRVRWRPQADEECRASGFIIVTSRSFT